MERRAHASPSSGAAERGGIGELFMNAVFPDGRKLAVADRGKQG